jgi:hypothetical protein
MSAAVLTGPDVAARLVEARAVLGGERDVFRRVWDHEASAKDRRLLLAMAGASAGIQARWKSCAWADLPAALRGDVVRGLARFKGWAARIGEDESGGAA